MAIRIQVLSLSMNAVKLSIRQDKTTMKMEMNIDKKYLDKNNYNVAPIQTLKGIDNRK